MDKFDYFLFLKKKYGNILQNLNEISNSYQEINSYEENEIENEKKTEFFQDNKTAKQELFFYKEQIQNIENQINNITTHIQNNCEHHFIRDLIDISPEKSQHITYCIICEKTDS